MPATVTYKIAPKGLATSFTESELPPSYASKFRNRFINQAGGAEKRQGMEQIGSTISGAPTITGIHELIGKTGNATLFVSGNGNIWKYDGASAYTLVLSGKDGSARMLSVQMGDKLIFVNGVDRNFFTEDGTTFTELKAIVEQGFASTGTSANRLKDADIANWVTGTDVVANDLVYYKNVNAYGLVTLVSGAEVTHTAVSAASKGIGRSTADVSAGDAYEIIDLVELNIIDAGAGLDNVGTAGSGTTTTVIAVSGVNFSNTEIRVGDIVSNTTRAAVTDVVAVSANINVTTVAGQTTGDSLLFFKSAMPISSFAHIHYGRVYHVDARDKRQVRISGAADPQDMTTDAGTLDSITFRFGDLQGRGDVILALGSFQRYFVLLGEENVYLYSGTTPIGTGSDFSPAALFPQGCISRFGAQTTGNDLIFVSHDGLQAVQQVQDETHLNRAGITFAINSTLREELDATPEDQIILVHYRQRSWVVLKVGSKMYVYNYTTYIGDKNENVYTGSITLFDGKFARQSAFLERRDGTLVCAGDGGKVYIFDVKGLYTDDGEVFTTEYRTGHLTYSELRTNVRTKALKYLKPIVEAGANIAYTIRAEGDFASRQYGISTDTITATVSGAAAVGVAAIPFTIGGSPIVSQKYPLRVTGETVRLSFTTQDSLGPDILSRYTLYPAIHGAR